jgi:hypothetical protein
VLRQGLGLQVKQLTVLSGRPNFKAMLSGLFVTTAGRVLGFWMEGGCEYVDKQPRIANNGWSSSLGVG